MSEMHAPLKQNTLVKTPEPEVIPTYYGKPALKASDYQWSVGFYIFLGGLAAGTQILVTLADWLGIAAGSSLIFYGRGLALFAAALGGLLLISKLHVPQRFYNMLRIFRSTSAMSIGTYLLVVFSFLSAFAFVAEWLAWRGTALIFGTLASFIALGMTTYTASLLATTSTPLWSAAPILLAVRFAAAAMASGAAALCLLCVWPLGERSATNAFAQIALLAVSTDVIATALWQVSIRMKGITTTPWDGDWGSAHFLLLLVGGVLPIVLYSIALTNEIESLAFVASLILIFAGSLLRVAVLYAGNRSAERPLDYFRLAGGKNSRQRRKGLVSNAP